MITQLPCNVGEVTWSRGNVRGVSVVVPASFMHHPGAGLQVPWDPFSFLAPPGVGEVVPNPHPRVKGLLKVSLVPWIPSNILYLGGEYLSDGWSVQSTLMFLICCQQMADFAAVSAHSLLVLNMVALLDYQQVARVVWLSVSLSAQKVFKVHSILW